MSRSIDKPFDNAASDATAPRGRPDPDPIEELATINSDRLGNDPDRPHLARQPGPQPGFGPDEMSSPEFRGNPALGIDPREAAAHIRRHR